MLMIFWYSLWYPHQRDQNMASFLHSFWVFYNQTKREQLPSCYQVCSNVQTTIIITFPIHLRTTRLGSICLLSNAGWITGICTTKLSASYRHTLAGFASLKSWIIFLNYRPNGSILVWIIVLINIICLRFVSKLEWESQFWISRYPNVVRCSR